MPAGVEPHTLILAAFIVLAASVVKSTTGFGFGLIAVPLLLLLWEPAVVVPILLPLVFAVDVSIVAHTWRRLDLRRVGPMAVAGVVGIPLGTYVLLVASPQVLRLAIAGLVLVSAGLLLTGVTITISRERLAGVLAGFLSGLLITSTSMSGPPVALLLINQRWAKDTFRSSLGVFFLGQVALAMVSLAGAGALDTGTLLVSVVLLPPVLLGFLVAVRLLPHVSQQAFLRVATFVIMGAGVLTIANALL